MSRGAALTVMEVSCVARPVLGRGSGDLREVPSALGLRFHPKSSPK